MTTAAQTPWHLRGTGYEFCNCDFGCGCNFGGFPNSKDGSCRALVALQIGQGACGTVDLSGLTCAAVYSWPRAIHQGEGKCVFMVEPDTSEVQADALGQIFTGQLGGMPWEVLGTTFEVIGFERTRITIDGTGLRRTVRVEGFGQAVGDTFKNPVTGDEHHATVELPDGFIWTRGQCGAGTFSARAHGLNLSFDKTNWILYDFDWTNRARAAA